jgi:hypothetical protein
MKTVRSSERQWTPAGWVEILCRIAAHFRHRARFAGDNGQWADMASNGIKSFVK